MITGAFVGGEVGPQTAPTLPRINIHTGDDTEPSATPAPAQTPAPTVRPVPKPTRDESPVAIYRNVIDPEFTSIATTHKWSC
ncbi:hypothetical protein [Actinokineospora inagensis]|uniref:hypothetical protein n=1 Tax=Actinokineospora inagensis TaxID=103730 RepID=UPI0003FBA3BF|nr:hypothetical protein [Actinokineospora inagensis]